MTLSASTVRIQKAPKFVYHDSNAVRGKAALEEIYFVDETEAQVAANKAIGINGAEDMIDFLYRPDAALELLKQHEIICYVKNITHSRNSR